MMVSVSTGGPRDGRSVSSALGGVVVNGSCPRCQGSLEEAEFAEEWNLDGTVRQTQKDPACRRCGVRWQDFDLAAEEEIQHN
jgi:C4-type Zn-finger protein